MIYIIHNKLTEMSTHTQLPNNEHINKKGLLWKTMHLYRSWYGLKASYCKKTYVEIWVKMIVGYIAFAMF